MATLPNLNKDVFKDPVPPAFDSVQSPIVIPNDTLLITTKTTNETIDNVNQLIDYVSGDNDPNFIPQVAIFNLETDLAARELLANKGAASGYAGLDSLQKLLLGNFPSGLSLQVLRRNFDNDALEFFTLSDLQGITSINSETGAAQTIAGTTNRIGVATTLNTQTLDIGTDVVTLTGAQTLADKTLTTPTITSFTNATHDHEDAAGGGQLLSTAALSDTANIAYLNTPNTYVAGNKQSFVANATTAALNLNEQLPSGLAAGDIYRTAEVLHFIGTTTTDYTLVTETSIQTLTNKTLTTPTISNFTNATHDHEDAAGGGQLLSTAALSDTANIAYLDANINLLANSFQEGGVNISPIGIHDIGLPATAYFLPTTEPATGLTNINFVTNGIDKKVFEFATVLDERIQTTIYIPRNWDEGTVDIELNWSFGTGSGIVRWAVRFGATGDDEPIDNAFAAATFVNDTAGTANQLQKVVLSSIAMPAGIAPGDEIQVEIFREGTNGADTFNDTARLHGTVLRITTDEATAA